MDQNSDERLRLFSAGEYYSNSSERNFNFSTNPSFNSVIFTARRHDGKEFLNFSSSNSSKLFMRNFAGEEIFKIAYAPSFDNTVAENFIHMPNPNSRIVIGNFGNYLLNQNHKFVVSDGDALIEGNAKIDGVVTIGTDSFNDSNLNETFELSVSGNMRAEKVRVYTGWADYVFSDNYDLMKLNELEKYIKENKHLPNVPTAAEVSKNGIELGDTNRVLLEKIEELTLYVIELNKKIELLEEENSEPHSSTIIRN